MSVEKLTTLQIKIMLRCSDAPISKRDVTQLYKVYKKDERDQAIQSLISQNLLSAEAMPQKGVRKTPTFYFITEQGKQWLKQYQKNYPR